MSRLEIWAFILGIGELLIGLPSFLFLFFSKQWVEAILVLVILIIITAFILELNRRTNLPLWTILELHHIYKILKSDGSLATVTKFSKLQANHKGQTEFCHRNIRADGEIKDFRFKDDEKVPAGEMEPKLGEYTVRERFINHKGFHKDEIVKKGKPLESYLSYILENSFLKFHEFCTYCVDYSTSKYRIEIHFPKDRPPKNPIAYKGSCVAPQDLPNPKIIPINNDGKMLFWEGKNLKPGERYTFEWDW